MNFKKEDIGLYAALTLLGAGAGLLIGSVVANVLAERRIRKDIESRAANQNFEWDDEDAEDVDLWVDIDPSVVEVEVEEITVSDELQEEMTDLAERFGLTQLQEQLLIQGLITPKEMENALKLIEEENSETYSYAAPVKVKDDRVFPVDEKPDLVEEPPADWSGYVVAKTWNLSPSKPLSKPTNLIKVVYYDRTDDTWAIQKGNTVVPLLQVHNMFPVTLQDAILELLKDGIWPIFATDSRTNKVYSIEYMGVDDDELGGG